MIIDGGACDVGLESTVVDVRSTPVRVLRPGGVTPRMIADVLGEVEVDGSVLRPLKQGEIVRSPGMKYKHYAPDGSLVIVKGSAEKVAAGNLRAVRRKRRREADSGAGSAYSAVRKSPGVFAGRGREEHGQPPV